MTISDRWGYLNGTIPRPTPADSNKVTTTEKEEDTKWVKNDAIASYLLSQRLPR